MRRTGDAPRGAAPSVRETPDRQGVPVSGVGVGASVGAGSGLGVGVGVGVGVGWAVGVGVGLGVGWAVGIGVGVGVGWAVGVAVGLGVGWAVGVAVGLGCRLGSRRGRRRGCRLGSRRGCRRRRGRGCRGRHGSAARPGAGRPCAPQPLARREAGRVDLRRQRAAHVAEVPRLVLVAGQSRAPALRIAQHPAIAPAVAGKPGARPRPAPVPVRPGCGSAGGLEVDGRTQLVLRVTRPADASSARL